VVEEKVVIVEVVFAILELQTLVVEVVVVRQQVIHSQFLDVLVVQV
jgi:hypothetical protein